MMAKKSMIVIESIASFLGGLVLTILLVVVLPIVLSSYIEPFVIDIVDAASLDDSFIILSPGVMSAIVIFLIVVLFLLLLGGGAILRRFGIIGIVGLIIAYVWFGYVWEWIIPVTIVFVFGLISYYREKRRCNKMFNASGNISDQEGPPPF